jgi:hypothetical protein
VAVCKVTLEPSDDTLSGLSLQQALLFIVRHGDLANPFLGGSPVGLKPVPGNTFN